jgi:hypothetical protein
MKNNIKGKIICLADGIEAGPSDEWISAGCSIKKSENISYNDMISNLRSMFKELLTRFPQFRLKLPLINNLRYWVLLDLEDCNFGDLIKTVELPKEQIPESFPIDELPIWRLYITEVEDNKVRFRFSSSHSFVDGHSIFSFLDFFINLAENKKFSEDFLKAENLPLTNSFQKKELFTKEIYEDIKSPESWKKLQKCKLYPEVQLPSHCINVQWDFDYPPISKFNRKYNFTCQALLMAIIERALRKYHKGKIDDLTLGVYCPTDTRQSKYATEIHRKGKFFNAAGLQIIYINKQNSLMEDIKHCKEELKKVLNTTESCATFCYEEGFVDKEKKEMKFDENFPILCNYNLIFASNIGKVCVGREDVSFNPRSNVDEYGYWTCLYSLNNGKTLSVILVHPYNVEKEFINLIYDSLIEVINFIKDDK